MVTNFFPQSLRSLIKEDLASIGQKRSFYIDIYEGLHNSLKANSVNNGKGMKFAILRRDENS